MGLCPKSYHGDEGDCVRTGSGQFPMSRKRRVLRASWRGAACVALSWGVGFVEGMVVAVAYALAPQFVEAPSRHPLLCQAVLSCSQLSQGHGVTGVMLSGFTSCWAPPAPLWPRCWEMGISSRDRGWPQPRALLPSAMPLLVTPSLPQPSQSLRGLADLLTC